MRLLYAVQFRIVPREGSTVEGTAAELRSLSEAWIRDWYAHWKHITIEIPLATRRLTPMEGHSVLPAASTASTGENVWGVTWSYPDDRDPTERWEAKVSIARSGSELEFSLALHLSSTSFIVAPLRYTLGPPRLVRELIEGFDCRAGTVRLSSLPKSLTAQEVPEFVERILLSPDRGIPVVMISPWISLDLPAARVNADAVARKLSGLALVVTLTDQYASWSLTEALSKELSCYLGATRIYWPGLTRESNPFDHSLYLPVRIQRVQAGGTRMEDHFLQRFANIASSRYGEGPILRKVREATQADQAERQRLALAELQSTRATAASRAEQIGQLTETLNQSAAYIKTLEDDVENLRNQWRDFSRYTEREEESESISEPTTEVEIDSIKSAVDKAEADFSPWLVVWPSAKASAESSHSVLGPRVFQALNAMADVARESFTAKAEKRSMGGDLERAFKARGFKYRANESDTAMGGRMGMQRRFRNGSDERIMERHLTIGGGDPVNSIRIHFDIDDTQQKFVIGYCGVHLDIPRART